MAELNLIYAPRAQRDLMKLPKRQALMVLDDLEILKHRPWPPGKVKKLRGAEYWEIKNGDYRTIFLPDQTHCVILRIIPRRDLEQALERIDVRALKKWVREQSEEKF